MKRGNLLIVSYSFIFLLLFLGGCSRTVERTAGGEAADGISISAAFEGEDGAPLSGCAVRLSDGEDSADYQSDQNGALTVAGLPAEGALTVAVLDGKGEAQGTVTLSFSQGAVIDAVTDENAVGRVTLKEDTREIALTFTLYDDGTLRCGLKLSEERIV